MDNESSTAKRRWKIYGSHVTMCDLVSIAPLKWEEFKRYAFNDGDDDHVILDKAAILVNRIERKKKDNVNKTQ